MVGQIGAARVDEVDAGQPVLARDFLRAQVLLHRHRKIRAALDGRVVADDDAFAARDAADARDDARGGDSVAIHAIRGELRELEEGTPRIEQRAHAFARQQLAACRMLGARRLAPPLFDVGNLGAQVRHQRGHRVVIPREPSLRTLSLDSRMGIGAGLQTGLGRGCPGISA